jgi:hypothetical protein
VRAALGTMKEDKVRGQQGRTSVVTRKTSITTYPDALSASGGMAPTTAYR